MSSQQLNALINTVINSTKYRNSLTDTQVEVGIELMLNKLESEANKKVNCNRISNWHTKPTRYL